MRLKPKYRCLLIKIKRSADTSSSIFSHFFFFASQHSLLSHYHCFSIYLFGISLSVCQPSQWTRGKCNCWHRSDATFYTTTSFFIQLSFLFRVVVANEIVYLQPFLSSSHFQWRKRKSLCSWLKNLNYCDIEKPNKTNAKLKRMREIWNKLKRSPLLRVLFTFFVSFHERCIH